MDVLSIIEKANSRALSQRKRRNVRSVAAALDKFGKRTGLDQPHRMAHYLAQLAHESMGFHHDKEIWGPTAAQKRYEGRRDLGNTQPGDGKRFSGRGPIQITGRHNYRVFSAWAKRLDRSAPDFEVQPEAVNTDPWEGLAPIWYWDEGNPTSKSLNRFADQNDIEMVTRRINGGLNGYSDRQDWYVRIALVMNGFGPKDVETFQRAAGLTVDGIAGSKTRGALHRSLVALSSIVSEDVRDAPVVHEIERRTVPPKVEEKVEEKSRPFEWLTGLFGVGGGAGAMIFGMPWQTAAIVFGAAIVTLLILIIFRRQIIGAVRDVRREVEG